MDRVSSLRRKGLQRGAVWGMAAWAAAMYALMFVHLLADFPRAAPWSDMSKCTDEGWYAGGALHHFVFGHWYLPYAFNPTVVMPTWSVMLVGWFALMGHGMMQARVLTVLLYGVSLALFAMLLRGAGCRWITCAAAVLLMCANPFCYVFDRMALLEPVSVFWWVLGLWVAGRAADGTWWKAALTGCAMVVLVLAKTTSITMAVSIVYFLYSRAKQERNGWARPVLLAGGTAAGLWAVYFFAWVRPRYLRDFEYLFLINHDRSHLTILPHVISEVLCGGMWMNAALLPLAGVLLIVVTVRMRAIWSEPLFGAMLVAVGADSAFIIYHGNIQPRYFLVLVIPVVTVALMAVERLWLRTRMVAAIAAGILVAIAVKMTVTTVSYVRHPGYTFRDMAAAIAETMRADEAQSPVLFSGAGDDISLFTGVRAISLYEPDGPRPLLDHYQPEWMGVWLPWEAAFPTQVSGQYELRPVKTFRVYEDQTGHDIFVLYRMTPRSNGTVSAAR